MSDAKKHPKSCTCPACKKAAKKDKSAKRVVKEDHLQEFINQIVQKNYKEADKYLQREIDSRIKAKISKVL